MKNTQEGCSAVKKQFKYKVTYQHHGSPLVFEKLLKEKLPDTIFESFLFCKVEPINPVSRNIKKRDQTFELIA